MNRTKSIIAAGSLTGLVLATVLALGFRDLTQVTQTTTPAPEIILQPLPPDSTADPTVAELQAQIDALLAREGQYQAVIEQANQTIIDLQTQQTPLLSAQMGGGGEYEEHDEHEEHEHDEHEEHEHDEHEEHEHDEHEEHEHDEHEEHEGHDD